MMTGSPADKVIETFGGLSATARALGIAVTTVQGWRVRGRVPQEHWPLIISKADDAGTPIGLSDLAGIAA